MEEGMNFREPIEVIIRDKWIIIGVTVISMFFAGIISFFVLSPKYEASATILVKKQADVIPNISSVEELLNSLSKSSRMTLESYRQQSTGPWIFQQVIDELELDPEEYNVVSLQGAVSSQAIKDTNMIKIKMSGSDPEIIAAIVNTLAQKFTERFSDKTITQINKSVELLSSQLIKQENELAEVAKEYQEFLALPQGVQELQNEVSSKLFLITDFKNQLICNQVTIEETKAALKQVEADMEETPKMIITKKTLIADQYLFNVVETAAGASVKEISGLKMESEEINPTYINLVDEKVNSKRTLASLSVKQEQLIKQISQAQKELESLQVELSEKQLMNDKLSQKVSLFRDNYQNTLKRYEEVKLTKLVPDEDNNLLILSLAMEPENPVGPNKKLNMAIAGVLGMMQGIFVVFLREWWRKSAPL